MLSRKLMLNYIFMACLAGRVKNKQRSLLRFFCASVCYITLLLLFLWHFVSYRSVIFIFFVFFCLTCMLNYAFFFLLLHKYYVPHSTFSSRAAASACHVHILMCYVPRRVPLKTQRRFLVCKAAPPPIPHDGLGAPERRGMRPLATPGGAAVV